MKRLIAFAALFLLSCASSPDTLPTNHPSEASHDITQTMHSVFQVQDRSGRTFCSASLVKRTKLVISAAHCFTSGVDFQLHGYYGTFPADIVYLNVEQDVAVLRPFGVELKKRHGIPLARKSPTFGDEVIAIGHAQGDRFPFTMTVGRVSHPHRDDFGVHWMQSDAILEQGMSGGPTLNEDGHLVGVNLFVFILPLSNVSGHAHYDQISRALELAR